MPPRPNFVRREQLLDELVQIFKDEGFLHLRIGSLASRLRCSRSTLYELADSKEALFVRVVERFADAVAQRALDAAEGDDEAMLRLRRLMSSVAQDQAQMSEEFFRDAYAFPPTADRFSEARSWGIRGIKQILDEGIKAGTVRPVNTEYLAHIVWFAQVQTRDAKMLELAKIESGAALMELYDLLERGVGIR